MKANSIRRSVDFAPLLQLAKQRARRTPKDVGIIVAPSGDPAAPFIGLVTADQKPIVSARLDQAGAASFVAAAMTRINETLPAARLQVVVEIDETATGPIVPTPPPKPVRRPKPQDAVLIAIVGRVFAYQRRHLKRFVSGARRAGGKAPRVRAKTQVGMRTHARAKAPARARRAR